MNTINYVLCELDNFLYGLASKIFSFLVLLNSAEVKAVNYLFSVSFRIA